MITFIPTVSRMIMIKLAIKVQSYSNQPNSGLYYTNNNN